MFYHVGPGYAVPNPEDTPYLEELARRERIDMEDIVPLPCQIDPRRDKYC